MIERSFFDGPIFILDFEASALGELSYPIEIGLAWAEPPFTSVASWSTLIKPTSNWRDNFEWSSASYRVHGINATELSKGMHPSEALAEASRILGDNIAYVDGGLHDRRWLARLAEAAGTPPPFTLGDWDLLISFLSPARERRAKLSLILEEAPHRAEGDCLRLMRALKVGYAMGVKPDKAR